ncbi:MAG: alpha/beta hydrolase [Bacillota bacterium]
MNKTIISERINKLQKDFRQNGEAALISFWEEISKNGAPIIESIEGNDKNVYVTAIWKDEGGIETMEVFGELFGMSSDVMKMEKLEGTDVWYKTCKAPIDARSLYVFYVNAKPDDNFEDMDVRLDPFNDNVITCVDDELNPGEYCVLYKRESMVELPGFKPCEYLNRKAASDRGIVVQSDISSEILGNSRRVWVYEPAGHKGFKEPAGMMIFMDGWEYVYETKLPIILDGMISQGIIPPVYCVFLDNRNNRTEELRLNKRFIDFLAREVTDWAKSRYRISDDPAKTLIGGFSAGGLTAGYAGYLYPGIFGKVLSQSGAFYWGYDEENKEPALVKYFEEADKLPLEIYMSLGEFEKFEEHLNANLKLYEILKDKGYRVKYKEFSGGHTFFDAQMTIAEGLEFLLGSIKEI